MNNKNKLTKIARILINDSLSDEQKLENIKIISLKYNTIRDKKSTFEYKYTIQDIEDQICTLINKDIDYIRNVKGKGCIYRNMAFYKSMIFTKETQSTIYSHFCSGKVNRSTVSRSKQLIENALEVDKEFRELYQEFLNQ